MMNEVNVLFIFLFSVAIDSVASVRSSFEVI